MKRSSTFAVVLILIALSVCGATAQPLPPAASTTAPTTRPTNNATAEHYRAVFVRARAENLDNEIEAALDPAQPGDQVDKFLVSQKVIVESLKQALTMPPAKWGDPEQGFESLLRDLTPARRCHRILALHLYREMASNHHAAVVDTILAQLALARNLGRQHLMVSRLVEVGIQQDAIESAARLIARLPRQEAERLRAGLGKLPSSSTLRQTYDSEKRYSRAESTKIPFTTDLSDAAWDVIIRHTDKGPSEFLAAIEAESNRNINPMFKVLYPSVVAFHPAITRADKASPLLEAGITVLLDGPNAVHTISDAFGSLPVQYSKTDSGFELSAERAGEREPIKLAFPTK